VARAALLFLLLAGCVADTGGLILPSDPKVPEEPADPERTRAVEISPRTIDFRSVPRGGRVERSILLVNHTPETTRVTWSLDPGPFVLSGSGESTLQPDQREELTVVFEADTLGMFRERIHFSCDGGACATVELTGAAYDAVGTEEPLDCIDRMAIAEVGTCVPASVSCLNRAFSALEIVEAALYGDAALELDGDQTGSVASGEWITFDVSFCPEVAGWAQAELRVSALAADQNEYSARAVITAETPREEPPPPPPPTDNELSCVFSDPWTLGPTQVGEVSFWGLHCTTTLYEPLSRAEIVPASPSVDVTVTGPSVLVGYDHFVVIRFEPAAAGEVEAVLELEATGASLSIPLVLIGE
jgi:hypothetical protein